MTVRYFLKNGNNRTIEKGESFLDFKMVFLTHEVSPALKILESTIPKGRSKASTVIRTSGWGIDITSLTRGAVLNKFGTAVEPEVILPKRGARAEFSYRFSNNKRRTAVLIRK